MLQENQNNNLLEKDLICDEEAEELEKKYVTEVYEEIADHFSNTRYKPWPKVAEFLRNANAGSVILDVGCGNGRNMNLSAGCFEIGCDTSKNLAKVCSSRSEVLIADCMCLPFRNSFADIVICIAVIHHLSTKERRKNAIKELMRILHPNGKCLVYVWAMEQDRPSGKSVYLKKSLPFPLSHDVEEIKLSNSRTIQVPVHVNRTQFCSKDLLVPFKSGTKEKRRFYHLFQENELESLITECGFHILDSYYDAGNWCAIFRK